MKRALFVIALCLTATSALAGSCGFKPFPPLGCKIGPCVCDANGKNCQYVVIC